MQLEKSTNNKLITSFPKEIEDDTLFKVFGSLIKSPKHYTYYELYNKKGELVGIVTERSVAVFAAGRNDLDYREIEFTEEFTEEGWGK